MLYVLNVAYGGQGLTAKGLCNLSTLSHLQDPHHSGCEGWIVHSAEELREVKQHSKHPSANDHGN